MSSSSTFSLHLLSAATPLSSISKPPSLCIFPSSINTLPKLFSISTSTTLFKPSRLVPHLSVAAASFELYEDEEQQQPSYSPDLKLYVGNLPWNVDSAALAQLFQRAGNVEMVELH
ncbi:putative RNA recognition motif domain, nucleotide-binding alpha-beta plait domain superfamily [Helianthus anomalus]